ncbi:transcriptional regulator [Streptomyces yangpuensis]|uniref:transcriptional regulator n=1 Tax=Streptomyces yangpuensis TaxID=1648182 RepID=UPI00365A50EB
MGAGPSRCTRPTPRCPSSPRPTAGEAEFAVVQRQLDVSASVLSKHVTVLMEAGYVEQRKAVRNTRQRVWLHLTRHGREAYQAHLAALRAIVGP